MIDKELTSSITGLISATTALVAVFVGPIINAKIQHRQSVATMRHNWIQELRQLLSELFSTAELAATSPNPHREENEKFQELYVSITRLRAKIKMMLNPDKNNIHLQLQEKIEKIVTFLDNDIEKCDNTRNNMDKMSELIITIIPTIQRVINHQKL